MADTPEAPMGASREDPAPCRTCGSEMGSGIGFDACPRCGWHRLHEPTPLAAPASPETQGVTIGGDFMERPLWQWRFAVDRLLEAEQRDANPDTNLIGVLADAVRLSREYERVLGSPAASETAVDDWKPGAPVPPPYTWPHHPKCDHIVTSGALWCDCRPAASGTAQPVGEDTLRSALAAIAGRKEDLARWLEERGTRSQSAADLAADDYPPGKSNVSALQSRIAELTDFAIAARTVAKTALHIADPPSPGERTPERDTFQRWES